MYKDGERSIATVRLECRAWEYIERVWATLGDAPAIPTLCVMHIKMYASI